MDKKPELSRFGKLFQRYKALGLTNNQARTLAERVLDNRPVFGLRRSLRIPMPSKEAKDEAN